MNRLLSHLGTILIVGLLAAIALVVVLANPQQAREAIQAAFSGATPGTDQVEQAEPSLWATLQQSRLLSENPSATWVVVAAAVFLGFLVGKVAAAAARRAGGALARRGSAIRAHAVASLAGPLSLAILTFGVGAGVALLETGDTLGRFLEKTLLLLYVVSAVWYVFNLIALVDVAYQRARGRIESRLDAQLIPLLRKSLRTVLVLLAALFVAKNTFGADVTAWLAGLGIAGLAISLAAQDSLKSLFGAVVILLDRPFKVGERILYGGYDGVIEDIGFRSTKIRTADGHLVTIPNANLASNPIENVGRRPFIRRTINVTITYDTSREKIAEAVATLKRILAEDGIREPIHPTVDGKHYPPRVFFNDYKPDCLNLMVMYWYAPPEYWDYMEHAQRVNLRIFEEFERAGIEFAFPTQTVHLASDGRQKAEPRP